MPRPTLLSIYGFVLVLIMALIVVHAPLIVGFGTLFPDLALVIKAWKEILMILASGLAVVLVSQAGRWREFMSERLLQLMVGYAALHIIMLSSWQGASAALAGLAIDLRFIVYFVLVYVLIRLAPSFQRVLLRVAIGGAALVIGFTIIQLFLPIDSLSRIGYTDETITPYTTIDRNLDYVRYQSTLRGPNPLGAYAASVVIICAVWLSAGWIRTKKLDWRIALLALAGLIATYVSHSRSAFVALASGLGIIAAVRLRERLRPWHYLAIGAIGLIIVLAGFMLRSSDVVSNVVLHENPGESNAINSNQGHVNSLLSGSQRMLRQPFGAGVGSTGSASLLSGQPNIIENQYLLITHEVGWLGLGLFVAIYAVIMQRLWLRRQDPWPLGLFASGVGLAFIGLLLPVWADDTVAILWWGLAAIAISRKS